MLERIPAAKDAIRSPARVPTKDSLVAAMKAQRPLIDNISKDPQIILCKLTGADAALRERITSDPQDGFHLALLAILSGRIDEEKTPEGRLPFPLPVPQDVFILAREVGAIWDNETWGDRGRMDIPGAFANPSSELSSLFSLRTDFRVSLGNLLEEAESRANRIEHFTALAAFRSGALGLDGLKEHYAKGGIVLLDAELGEDRVILKVGENPVQIHAVERQLDNLQEIARGLLLQVAKRMSVGFTPLL